MPYKDPEKQREAIRRWFNRRYAEDAAFREAEAKRKAEWFARNQARLAEMRAIAEGRRKRKKPPEQGAG